MTWLARDNFFSRRPTASGFAALSGDGVTVGYDRGGLQRREPGVLRIARLGIAGGEFGRKGAGHGEFGLQIGALGDRLAEVGDK